MTSPLSSLASLFSNVQTQAASAPWAQKTGESQALQGLSELLSGGQDLPGQAGGAAGADGTANPAPLGPQLPSQSFSLPLLSALLEHQLQAGAASASSTTQAASASSSSASSTLSANAQTLASNLIASLNPGGNGELSLSQVEAALGLALPDGTTASASASASTSSAATSAATQAFNALDTNHDGELSASELGAGLQSLAQNLAAQPSATPHHHHHHHHAAAPDPADASSASASTSAVSIVSGTSDVTATTAAGSDATTISIGQTTASSASATS